MKKQVCFDTIIKSSLNFQSQHVQESANMLQRIHQRIVLEKNEAKKVRYSPGLKYVPVAACLILMLTVSTMAFSPQARAYAVGIAENLGIKIFTLSEDDKQNIRNSSEKINVDQMQEGETKNAGGLTIQKAEQSEDSTTDAVLEHRVGEGASIERKVDSFKVDESLKAGIQRNAQNPDGEIELEKSEK